MTEKNASRPVINNRFYPTVTISRHYHIDHPPSSNIIYLYPITTGAIYIGKYDLSENLLLPCLAGRQQKLGPESPLTLATLHALKELAEALQRSR